MCLFPIYVKSFFASWGESWSKVSVANIILDSYFTVLRNSDPPPSLLQVGKDYFISTQWEHNAMLLVFHSLKKFCTHTCPLITAFHRFCSSFNLCFLIFCGLIYQINLIPTELLLYMRSHSRCLIVLVHLISPRSQTGRPYYYSCFHTRKLNHREIK